MGGGVSGRSPDLGHSPECRATVNDSLAVKAVASARAIPLKRQICANVWTCQGAMAYALSGRFIGVLNTVGG
jgi:hypothetical protein